MAEQKRQDSSRLSSSNSIGSSDTIKKQKRQITALTDGSCSIIANTVSWRIQCARARKLLLKIMAVLEKVGMLREQLPSVLVDPCLYYCCTTHQALAALRSLCTEGCVRTA